MLVKIHFFFIKYARFPDNLSLIYDIIETNTHKMSKEVPMLHFLATLIRKLLKLVMALVLLVCVAALTICGVSGYAVYHEATRRSIRCRRSS